MLQYVAVRCRVSWCVAVCCSHNFMFAFITIATSYCSVLRRIAVRCSALLCVAECCIVLHCVAVTILCSPSSPSSLPVAACVVVCCSVLQCVAACCSVLQCVVVCCSVLRCVAAECCSHNIMFVFLPIAASCCSALQCVAVRCSALQCVAVRCSALQSVMVCCIVLQSHFHIRLHHYRRFLLQ